MKKLPFSFDSVLKEIEKLNQENPEGFTIKEMSRATSRDRQWCRERLQDMMDAGKARFNGKRRTMAIDGSTRMTPVYTLVK